MPNRLVTSQALDEAGEKPRDVNIAVRKRRFQLLNFPLTSATAPSWRVLGAFRGAGKS